MAPTNPTEIRRAWRRTVRARAWDKSRDHFGWVVPLVVGAGAFGLAWLFVGEDEAVSNYLVPSLISGSSMGLTAGAILGVNLVRAAGDLHVERIAAFGHLEEDLDVEVGQQWVFWPTTADETGTWLVFKNVTITNRSDRRMPLDLWITVGVQPGFNIGSACVETPPPAWVGSDETLVGARQIGRVVNLEARSAIRGFCFSDVALAVGNVEEAAKQLVHERPLWLTVKNLTSGETRNFPANPFARYRVRPGTDQQAEADPVS